MEPHLPETTVEKMLIQSAASKGRPITATLELTPLCNLRCENETESCRLRKKEKGILAMHECRM